MMNRGVPVLAAAILLFLPMASAQSLDSLEVSFEPGERELIPGQATSIAVTVEAACALILTEGEAGALNVEIGHNLPADWNINTPTITLNADQDCLTNSGTKNGNGTMTVTPPSSAPGLQPFDLVLNASAGDATAQSSDDGRLYVAYIPGHSIGTDRSFPYTMTNNDDGAVDINVTIQVTANADTMVMFTDVQAAGGTLVGLDGQTFAGNESTRTIQVSWTPPADWEEANISFQHFSHCTADGFNCDPVNQRNVTWQIENGLSNNGGKSSPGIGIWLTLALAAAAWVKRRG